MLHYFHREKEISKVGILVRDLRASTLSYNLIDTGNRIANECTDVDFYVFNEDARLPPKSIGFPTFQYRNAWAFDGVLISTDINTTRILQRFPDTCKKFFYVWNMQEWHGLSNIDAVHELYCDPKIELIARSDEYAAILLGNFNREAYIIEDFNYEQLHVFIK
jgi:hypothetical protein